MDYKQTIIWKKLSKIRRKFFLPFRIDGRGERVEIDANNLPTFAEMNIYQKSHIKRYEFAQQHLHKEDSCADLACGTGYGTVIMSKKCKHVTGVDVDKRVIKKIKSKYKDNKNVSFVHKNLLKLKTKEIFDSIVSFETIEHLQECDIPKLFSIFNRSLKPKGALVFSTPYKQEATKNALEAGFHLTFGIDETKINEWLKKSGFTPAKFYYQNYSTHTIGSFDQTEPKDFIIATTKKQP
jgi:2-polyprenyl-3-methyl-5-hydroxy-6-metoxy-1,4-benzoquinol methylase